MNVQNALTLPNIFDEQAIIALTRCMTAAWNAGDAEAYGALFAPDSDYIAFDGTWLAGRESNVEHHRWLFATVLRGSRLVFEGKPRVRFLSRDVAVVHAMGSVLLPWHDKVSMSQRSLQTYVARRGSGSWHFAAFHNTRFRPLRLPSGAGLCAVTGLMRVRSVLHRALGGRRSQQLREH